jgi:hypothetical protein
MTNSVPPIPSGRDRGSATPTSCSDLACSSLSRSLSVYRLLFRAEIDVDRAPEGWLRLELEQREALEVEQLERIPARAAIVVRAALRQIPVRLQHLRAPRGDVEPHHPQR